MYIVSKLVFELSSAHNGFKRVSTNEWQIHRGYMVEHEKARSSWVAGLQPELFTRGLASIELVLVSSTLVWAERVRWWSKKARSVAKLSGSRPSCCGRSRCSGSVRRRFWVGNELSEFVLRQGPLVGRGEAGTALFGGEKYQTRVCRVMEREERRRWMLLGERK